MKKTLAILLAALMTGSFSACGSTGQNVDSNATKDTSAEEQATPQTSNDRAKISILMRSSEDGSTYKIWNPLFENFKEENYPDVKLEYELVPNDSDYVNKLQLYVSSNSLPDFYGCANGSLSKAVKEIGGMADIGKELKRNGTYDNMNGAVIDFLTDAEDGELYLFPEGLYCEFFFYRKDIFEALNLEAPTTWNEFLEVCDALKSNGEIPVVVGGAASWQLMRYLSFVPWRGTHDEFIMGYIDGSDSFGTNEIAQTGVNLLATMGEKGYFQDGYTGSSYDDATSLFFGGTGSILYSGSGHIGNAYEMYEEGILGFFPVPDVDGVDNIDTNVPIHAGFGNAFNAQTYDTVMQEFFDYACENYSEVCYKNAQIFSPFNDEIPEGLDQLFYDLYPMFSDASQSWVSWDDKLDSATLATMTDVQEELALGMISEEEFISTMDDTIAMNR